MNSEQTLPLQEAADIVVLAKRRGASHAECTISSGEEFNVSVRLGEVEKLTDSGSRAAGLRVLVGQRSGSSYTSDLSQAGIAKMVESALEIATVTSEDPGAGLPHPGELGRIDGDLGLYADSVARLTTEWKVAQAREAEAAALSADPRISNSEGGSFSSHQSSRVFANSLGFVGGYRTSSVSLSVVPVARQDGRMERDYWYSLARSASRLDRPADIGRIAAQRTVRRLGARKVPTQKITAVFEPRTAASLLGHFFEAVSGDAVYRQESFLAGKLGERVASEHVTLVDDGHLAGLFGSRPFDDEGVPTRRTAVIERGVLRSYLLNTYTAGKLQLKSTGNASRGLGGNTSVGHGNFYLEAGQQTAEEIIRSVGTGLLVTELLGFGVNVTTGDYSRGAAGIWIENGELAYPVAEVTLSSTLPQMLQGMHSLGNDLHFRGSVAAPTLVIPEMTLSGT